MRYYKLTDYAQITANYAGSLALATGAFMLGNNWTLVIGAGLSVATVGASMQISRKILEGSLERHPPSHIHSPNLKHMVDKLYNISGLKVEKNPVYDFKVANKKEKSIWDEIAGAMLEKMAGVPNAAASNITKPVIIISEPLLQLLDDDEEYGVLAHEFVHAGANHQWATLPKNLLSSAAAISNSLVTFVEMIAAGIAGIIASIVASGVTSSVTKPKMQNTQVQDDLSLTELFHSKVMQVSANLSTMASMPKITRKLRTMAEKAHKKPKVRTPEEFAAQRHAKMRHTLLTQFASVGAITAFNPLYAPVWAGVKAMNTGLVLSSKKLSRIFEYQADRGAVETFGANPLALARALRKINLLVERSQRNTNGFAMSDVKQSKLAREWTKAKATHPTVPQRVEELIKLARKKGMDEAAIEHARNGELKIGETPDMPVELVEAVARQFHIDCNLV